ncbi:unnamed protein product [Closterium sp. Naga37s-1]|nr:unnamed protein product [Closterium sp. Naga37s-1]
MHRACRHFLLLMALLLLDVDKWTDQIVPGGNRTDGKLSRGVLLCAAGIIAKSDLTMCVADGGLAGTDSAGMDAAGGEFAAAGGVEEGGGVGYGAAGTVPGGDWGGGEQEQQPSYVPDGAKSVKCRKKIVISLAVSNGHTLGTEAIEAVLTRVSDSTGAAGGRSGGSGKGDNSSEGANGGGGGENSTKEGYGGGGNGTVAGGGGGGGGGRGGGVGKGGEGTERRLADPVKITVVKTPVYAVYPLTFLQSFNGRPYEVVVTTTGCRDGAYDSDPTCGWFLYPDGSRVPNSQGFCCSCSGGDTWKDSIGLDNPQQFRADLDCSLWRQKLFFGGVPSSSHCLRFNDTWYPTYRIGVASLVFQIQITISKLLSDSHEQETLILSPTAPVAVNPSQSLSATLVGDFLTYTQLPNLSDRLLSVPLQPGSPTFGRFTSDTSGWLLVDKERYSLDGSECSKVGTSFSAFRFEPDRCQRSVGSCLSNQLLDFAQEDAQRVAQGLDPIHALSSLGPITTLESPNGSLSIALVVTQRLNSLITLEIAADDVTFIKNRSPGRIVSVAVPLFEAMSSEGRVNIRIANNGSLDADFTLTIQNCSSGVLPIPAQERSIAAGATTSFTFLLQLQDSLASQRSCLVVLYDAISSVADVAPLAFTTNATVDNRGAQSGQSDGKAIQNTTLFSPRPGSSSSSSSNSRSSDSTCSLLCDPSIFSYPPPPLMWPIFTPPHVTSSPSPLITPASSLWCAPPRPRPPLLPPALSSQDPLTLAHPPSPNTTPHPLFPPRPAALVTLALLHRSGVLLPALALPFFLLHSPHKILLPSLTPHLPIPPLTPCSLPVLQLSSPWPCFIALVCSSPPSPSPSSSCTLLTRPSYPRSPPISQYHPSPPVPSPSCSSRHLGPASSLWCAPPRPRPPLLPPALSSQDPLTLAHPPSPNTTPHPLFPPRPAALVTLALLHRSGVLLPALALPFFLLHSPHKTLLPSLTPHLPIPPLTPCSLPVLQLSSPWPCFIALVCSSPPSPSPSSSCTLLTRPSYPRSPPISQYHPSPPVPSPSCSSRHLGPASSLRCAPPRPRPPSHPPSAQYYPPPPLLSYFPPALITLAMLHRSGVLLPALALPFSLLHSALKALPPPPSASPSLLPPDPAAAGEGGAQGNGVGGTHESGAVWATPGGGYEEGMGKGKKGKKGRKEKGKGKMEEGDEEVEEGGMEDGGEGSGGEMGGRRYGNSVCIFVDGGRRGSTLAVGPGMDEVPGSGLHSPSAIHCASSTAAPSMSAPSTSAPST